MLATIDSGRAARGEGSGAFMPRQGPALQSLAQSAHRPIVDTVQGKYTLFVYVYVGTVGTVFGEPGYDIHMSN